VNFESLLEAAQSLSIPEKFLEIWIPRAKLVSWNLANDSLSITRIDEPLFGFGFGPNPEIDPKWSACAITRSTPRTITENLKLVGQWDAYGIETKSFDINYEVLTDFEFIDNLIESNSPELSIRAEDQEVVAWVGIEEIAVGAICKWESGGHVLSAIVVDEKNRGQGLGKKITQALISEAFKRKIDYLALGVMAKNQAGVATYKSIGFEELGQFNTFKLN
jgi:ribosomal protein S18 acetylase RimI-like enzyme